VRFDVGCIFDAYRADIAQTAVLGPPDLKEKNHHDALVAGQGRMLEALKPGVTIGDLFQMGMKEVKEKGIPHYYPLPDSGERLVNIILQKSKEGSILRNEKIRQTIVRLEE
jgi:Xaa-Pro dipeptidase